MLSAAVVSNAHWPCGGSHANYSPLRDRGRVAAAMPGSAKKPLESRAVISAGVVIASGSCCARRRRRLLTEGATRACRPRIRQRVVLQKETPDTRAVRQWLDEVVIGMDFCPWAKPADDGGGIRIVTSSGTSSTEVMADLAAESMRMRPSRAGRQGETNSAQQWKTTLLVCPNVEAWTRDFASFHAFYVWNLDCGFALAENFGVKVSPFHPQYSLATDAPRLKLGDFLHVPGPDGEDITAQVLDPHVGVDSAGEPCMAVRWEGGDEGLLRHAALLAKPRTSALAEQHTEGKENEEQEEDEGDVCRNFTSRAPRPVLHILRVGDLDRADAEAAAMGRTASGDEAGMEDNPTQEILDRNERLISKLGSDRLRAMLERCG
eukprot:TRINITY_DN60458_c0_g1_i1.p1 TRINITY_DN60458_c0_g1~~TRINITY_DN60458_c0_g1_i1.p1  ORF type:complete len:400 (-),score=54.69 TRINITY_DN60458_c0_g1_i1:82-1212(-)